MATITDNKALPKPVYIALANIVASPALQPRVEMDREHQGRMERSYLDGEDIPPPIHVFFDGKTYWLADGFHRYRAMMALKHMGKKFEQIRCYVHEGTKQEAIEFAAQANLNNRSKPMNDADRKKAMWMLLDLPEWREKSHSLIGKTLELSFSASKKYWLEYFESRGIKPPDKVENVNGILRQSTRNKSAKPEISSHTKRGEKHYRASVGGRRISLGPDKEKALDKLDSIADEFNRSNTFYSSGSNISSALVRRNIFNSYIFSANDGLRSYPGFLGLNVRGIAVVWTPFSSLSLAPHVIGLAIGAMSMILSRKAVILCPSRHIPAGVVEIACKNSIAFMTFEDFAISLEADGESTSETGESPVE